MIEKKNDMEHLDWLAKCGGWNGEWAGCLACPNLCVMRTEIFKFSYLP
jgi:hypothetical protein